MNPEHPDDDTLTGTPSDQVEAILGTGRVPIGTLFVSMAERHPEGDDARYLRWHALDHRPEQHRLPGVLASLRVVSTPACRAARAVSEAPFDAVDHVMTYFFTDSTGLAGFADLSRALREAGRSPYILAPAQRGVYSVCTRRAAARARVGADVLPWLPVLGIYLLVEAPPAPGATAEAVAQQDEALIAVPGVAGLWCARAAASDFSTAPAGQRLTLCFLDDDPVAVAQRLRPVLAQRWQSGATRAALAAPFYAVIPYQWDRYLP